MMDGEMSLSALAEERLRLEREAFELEKARLEAARERAETELRSVRSGHPFLVISSIMLLALVSFAGGTLLGLSVAESRHQRQRESRLKEALSQIEGIASGVAAVSTNSTGRAVVSEQGGNKAQRNVAVVVIQ